MIEIKGVTPNHSTININLVSVLRTKLAGSQCRVFIGPVQVRTTDGWRHPDALVTCLPVPGRARFVTSPIVLFEILSQSTAGIDAFERRREYQAIPRVQRYVRLERNTIGATFWHKENQKWTRSELSAGETLDMPEIGVSIPLANLYDGVDFSEPAESA